MTVHSIDGATAAEVAEANRLLAANDAPAFRALLAKVRAHIDVPEDWTVDFS